MKYLFDSNVLGEMVRRTPNRFVQKRFAQVPHDAMFTSAICWYEISFGALRVADPGTFRRTIEVVFFPQLKVIPLTQEVAEVAAEIRLELSKTGRPAGVADVVIAATARRYDLTLVTRNLKDFRNVPGLKLENWFE